MHIIDKYIARLLMISFFLPMKWQVVAAGMACIYFVCRAFSAGHKVPHGNYLWALVLGSGFLLYLFSIPLTPQPFHKTLLLLCEQKASFLLMPFVFAIITPAFGALVKRELQWFVYTCFAVCIISNVIVLHHLYALHNGLHGISHVEYRSRLHDLTGIHPTYMAMYLCFSMCILLLSSQFNGRMAKTGKYVLLYLLLISFLALLAKAPLIALLIIAIHYAWLRRKTLYQYKILVAGVVAAIAAAWLFIPFVSQRINETFRFFDKNKTDNVIDNSVSARRLIWSIDTGLLRDYWYTGTGPGRLLYALHERYFFYSLGSGTVVPYYDPHNEYFWEWLSFGITGLVVFVSIFTMYLVRAVKVRDYLCIYLLLILYITFFTESVLSTQHGIMFYAVFTGLFFFLKPLPQDDDLVSPHPQ